MSAVVASASSESRGKPCDDGRVVIGRRHRYQDPAWGQGNFAADLPTSQWSVWWARRRKPGHSSGSDSKKTGRAGRPRPGPLYPRGRDAGGAPELRAWAGSWRWHFTRTAIRRKSGRGEAATPYQFFQIRAGARPPGPTILKMGRGEVAKGTRCFLTLPQRSALLIWQPLLRRNPMNSLLEHPVLVLNRFWQPIQTCAVRRSLHLLCTGHAEIVQVEGEECFKTHDLSSWIRYSDGWGGEGEKIRGVRISLLMPRIMVLSVYDRLPRLEVKFNRRNVLLRDKFTCQYCARVLPETQLNLDHVTPRDKGGGTTWENIVTSCFRCNTRKANKLPHEAGMHPHRTPFAPRWRPLFGLDDHGMADESWRHFLQPERTESLLSA